MKKFALLIGGCPRSGTTALLQVLNSNPQVFISSEENLLQVQAGLRKLAGTRERRAATLRNGMRALSPRETLTPQNIHSHNFSAEAAWPALRHLYKWHHRRLHPEAALLLWGDKYPNYFRDIEAVVAQPQVRYIHLTRHPLDVVDSMLRRSEMARQGRDWWRAIVDFDAMLAAWCDAYGAIRTMERHANVLHLQYEDLVFDFDATVQRINRFVEADLAYGNPLVDDPSRHFERARLSNDQARAILNHPMVVHYLDQAGGSQRKTLQGMDSVQARS